MRASRIDGREQTRHMRALYRQASARHGAHLPRDWRDRLPDPAGYYSRHLPKLSKPNAAGWAQARCPFHTDRAASLSVNLRHGGWRCFAGCGQGDMVSFHERLTGLDFLDAARELAGVRA